MAKKKGGGTNNNNGGGGGGGNNHNGGGGGGDGGGDNINNNGGCGGGGKKDDGGKKESGMNVVVLKIDLHCEGCAAKAIKVVRSFDGVESAKVGDGDLTKLTVVGKLDPAKLREKVEEKMKKKAELISPVAKKDNKEDNKTKENNCEEKKKPQQQQQKTDENKKKSTNKKDENKPKELPVTTTVLKIQWHCQGCLKKIQKVVSKSKGFMEMSIDKQKDLLTVKGAIDAKALAEKLKKKLRKPVEIVPSKKEGGGGGGGGDKAKETKSGGDGGDKAKETKSGGDGGEEKSGKGNGGGGGTKVVVEGKCKMERGGGDQVGLMEYPHEFGYGSGYSVNLVYAPQLFSDENPNACVVM